MSVDISLALHAVQQEGRTPMIVSHSWWVANRRPGVDYLVLQDDTFEEWANAAAH